MKIDFQYAVIACRAVQDANEDVHAFIQGEPVVFIDIHRCDSLEQVNQLADELESQGIKFLITDAEAIKDLFKNDSAEVFHDC